MQQDHDIIELMMLEQNGPYKLMKFNKSKPFSKTKVHIEKKQIGGEYKLKRKGTKKARQNEGPDKSRRGE